MKQKFTFLILACLFAFGMTAQATLVTSNADDGSGTLRQLISAAPTDGIIEIPEGMIITLASEIAFDKGLTIRGLGDGATVKVTSPGTSRWQIFNIGTSTAGNYNVVLENMNLIGGKQPTASASNGGVVYVTTANDGNVYFTMRNCKISKGQGNAGGGVMLNNVTGIKQAIIENCDFFDNAVLSNSSGGGLYIRAAYSEVTNCTFRNNTSPAGVAIGLNNGGETVISNCIFEGNIGKGPAKSAACISNANAALSVSNCVFVNNTNNDLTDATLGATAYSQASNITANFTNCTFYN
ncbi:hypothetical protein FACS189413_09000 [Bacteroidia bacterium]|nr:hypothetical protein FACS189413_09000 [Bacteroidia bacterium]